MAVPNSLPLSFWLVVSDWDTIAFIETIKWGVNFG